MMKNVDMNFIKYEKLFQDSLYNNVYSNSKYYEKLLPEHINLGKIYLKDFINYEVSKNELVPNQCACLAILIGCKEYLICDCKKERKELQLFFHCINLTNFDNQYIQVAHCDIFNSYTGRYYKGSEFQISLTNIDLYNDEFRKMVYDYLDRNDVLNKICPESDKLDKFYVKKDFIVVPF